jgi:dihydroxy-acid dehydratase
MTDKTQKSKEIREGWVQFDTLCCGTGWDKADLKNPQILVEDVFGSSHPGSFHLDALAEEVSTGVYQNGSIDPGSVIVLRYEGPRGSGMPEILATTEALVTNPKLQHTAIITDGRFSGATRGPCIGHVSPEAVAGGPIALVEDDDLLSIDIPGRNLNIVGHADRRMDSNEVQSLLAERKKQWKAPPLMHPRGVLKRYANQAVSAIKGAYLE